MVPDSPEKEGYRLMPRKYRMGSKAYGRSPPEWWTKLAKGTNVGPDWHKDDLPIAFAGEFRSNNGKRILVVVELYHAFAGDRALPFQTPGGQVYLVARRFSVENGQPKLLKEKPVWCDLEDLQYARLFAGQAHGRLVEFLQERGDDFDSRTVTGKRTSVLTVSEDGLLRFQKGEW
jgi:hypothetical protein